MVTHLNEVAAEDFPLLQRAPRFHVAHCPRSHAYFGHTRFPLRELQLLGFNICLGTDSLASNTDLSLFGEMRQLLAAEPALRPKDVLKMATVNAALALGQSETIGRIRANYVADLIAVPSTEKVPRLYDELVSFCEQVPWVMSDGRQVKGS